MYLDAHQGILLHLLAAYINIIYYSSADAGMAREDRRLLYSSMTSDLVEKLSTWSTARFRAGPFVSGGEASTRGKAEETGGVAASDIHARAITHLDVVGLPFR